jgi:hypothetical protein
MPCAAQVSFERDLASEPEEPVSEPEEPEQPEPPIGGAIELPTFRAIFLGELLALFHTLKITARVSHVPHLFQFLAFEDFVALAHRSS